MRTVPVFILSFCLAASALAQTQGVIDCGDRSGVPAWEKPRSLVEIKHLACGQKVIILSTDSEFVKVKINKSLEGFVEAWYVKPTEEKEPAPAPQIQAEMQAKEQPKASSATGAVPNTVDQILTPAPKNRILNSGPGLAFEVASYEYKEPGFMRDRAVMYGVYADYTFRPKKMMIRAETRFNFGSIDYTSEGTGSLDGIRDYVFDVRGSFGRTLQITDGAYVTPFMGFGYRYLFDDFGGKATSTGSYGYDRKARYIYSPVGAETIARLNKGWALGASGEYDIFWRGWQRSRLGDAIYGVPSVNNLQKDGWGVRSSVKIVKMFPKVNFYVEPFFRYWNIKDSEETTIEFGGYIVTAIEPANKTTEWGARIGVNF
jgi:hypothetical protein